MPPPYYQIPTLGTWQSDSSVWYASRSSDHALTAIDNLVSAYHNPALGGMQAETLFYLRSAILFWLKRINVVPGNNAPTGLNSTNLPATAKVNGNASRAPALQHLLDVVNSELRTIFNASSDGGLRLQLMQTYGANNQGAVSDQQWLGNQGHAAVSVYLVGAGMQRKYKLRFRSGVAWRWNPVTNAYSVFDSTDNRESEINDQMVHFVMNQKGAIYAGFDKNAVWFKHSSLVGGEDALAAGRMKVQHGSITLIENDSGHYAPIFKHMLNVLHRLQMYGSDLTNTRVRRVSDKAVFTAAYMLASLTSWPDGKGGY
jgi:hypothetical protein